MKKITLITGTMFSGKTTLLLQSYKKSIENNVNCLLIKPTIDNRYSETEIITHDRTFKIKAININYDNPSEVFELLKQKDYEKIYIDEISLFSKDLFLIVGKLSKKYDLILSGLETDFKKEYFYNTSKISEIANNIIKLPSICDCGNYAYYNQRYIKKDNSLILASPNEPIILVGSDNLYKAKCENCFVVLK